MPVAALNPRLLTPRSWAFWASCAVFAFGFGALNVFTVLGIGQPHLPGLYTFRSATVGDGLLLPLLAYSLTRAAGLQRGWTGRQRTIVFSVATLAALGGAALQAQWLLNPHPRLNWTFPAPHSFNLPGWYHAGFLIAACGFFGGVAALLLLRVRQEGNSGTTTIESRLRSVGALGVLTPALAFSGLLSEDNASVGGPMSFSPLATVVGSGVLLTLALCWAAGRVNARWCVLSVLGSFVPAVALSGIFLPGLVLSLVAVLPAATAGLVGAFSSSILNAAPGTNRLALAVCMAACAAGPVYAVSAANIVTIPRLAIGCAISLALVICELVILRSLLADTSVSRIGITLTPLAVAPLVAFALAGRYFAHQPRAVTSYGPIVGGISAALFLAVAARAVRIQFEPVIEAEKIDAPGDQITIAKWRAYLVISTAYAAALLACLEFIIGTTSSGSNWTSGNQAANRILLYLSLALLAMIALIWAMERSLRLLDSARLLPILAASGCLIWAAVMMVQLAVGYGGWKQTTLSAFAAFVAGLFVLEGVISNAAYIHNVPVTWQVMLVALSSGIAVGFTTAWMTGPALQSTDAVHSVSFDLGSLVTGVVACVALPFVSARTLPGATPPRQYVINKPLAGVLQDSFLVSLLAVSVSWVPNFFLAHLKGVDAWSGAVLFYFSLLSAAYVYVMRNNIGHFDREKQRFTAQAAARGEPLSTDDRQALAGLARHIRRQNGLAIIALFPLGLLAIINEVTGFDKGGIGQFLRVTT